MRLTEFLNISVNNTQIVGFLKGKLNLNINNYIIDIDNSEIVFNSSILNDSQYSADEFDKLLDSYGWRINFISTNKIVIRKSKDTFNEIKNKKYNGLYLKGSAMSEDKVKRIGFRPAKYNELLDNNIKIGPVYNEARVYMWSLEAIANYAESELDFWNNLKTTIENCRSYGKYIYLICLPDSIKVYKDPEYRNEADGACFTTSNIMPDYIELISYNAKYDDTIDELKQKIH